MHARIYQPAKTATSSGKYRMRFWVVEPEPTGRSEPDRLMGWNGTPDTDQQVRLTFPTREAAVAFCERKGMTYAVAEPRERVIRPKSYAENFIRKT
jgi:hypothetical protein